ncbi:SdrD B-like domain-containing protein [Streptomyces novaecaesareae]|uniref:SdrD B-like domain-containing protein n=1 Tax=Streptomyces novaecaesareae TaxID=68244 RepID=UPI0009978CDD|nr:SdrD B-like domain-containing protein [Streptomyces novaecaesareae]
MTTTSERTAGAARGPARRRPGDLGGRTLGGAVALAVAIGACSLAAAPSAFPQTGDGTVTVRVIRAVDTSGVWTPALEPGMAGVKVTLTDDAGAGIEGTTAADGTVTLAPATSKVTGGKYRVQVVNPKPGVLFPAFASRQGLTGAPNQLSSNEEFVDLSGGKKAEVTTGLWSPGDYCQKNAPLVTTCQPAPREGESAHTLASFPYSARGVAGTDATVTDLATAEQTGNLYGIAWNRTDKRLFSAASAKRTTAYGPGGAGAIYVTDPAQKKTTLFATVPDAGSTPHGPGNDDAFLPAVGKESLGGIKISDDGKDLFVVNLHDRKLYRYDATAPTAAEPKAAYPIPDPGCPAAGDWRPYGLGLQDGTGYLGGVCSGESTGRTSDLRAVVLPFDPATGVFKNAVLDQPLDYPRGSTVGGPCPGAGWFPWQDAFPATQNGRTCTGYMANPEPALAEIAFETDGSMLLAFRDRFGDQSAAGPTAGTTANVLPGGDLNKACPVNGTYVLDTNNGCGATTRGTRFFDNNRIGHNNALNAGMAFSKAENSIATSGYDTNGMAFGYGAAFEKRDGKADGGLRLNPVGQVPPFGKGAAMGDLEVLCDQAPLQIGNRVWYDPERSGLQLPGQRPVPGATVHLYDESGKAVGTAKTTARGEYYFDDSNVEGGLKPRTKYTIKLDNPADYAKGGPLFQWVATEHDVGDNHFVDSKGIVPTGGKYPERALTTGGPGENDHTYDFGFRQQEGALRLVKHDQDGKPLAGAKFQLWHETNGTDGLQPTGDRSDSKVGEPCTTGADGLCGGSGVPGTYYWQELSPPAGYSAPDVTVFGPLVLTSDNLDAGVEVTAVNRLIPTPTPTPTETPTPTPPPTTSTPVPAPPAPPAPPGPAPGHLPNTGASQAIPYAAVGAVALFTLGAALVLLARRRRAVRQD